MPPAYPARSALPTAYARRPIRAMKNPSMPPSGTVSTPGPAATVGTSMPELVTSVMAALRKHADVAYGNIVGSNIFNVLFILGATSIIQPIDMPRQIATFDIWVMLAATGLLVYFARTGAKLQRWEGWVFMACYAAYTGYLISIA